MMNHGIKIGVNVERDLTALEEEGKTTVIISVDNILTAIVSVYDTLKVIMCLF
jgi:cation transport ATPase